MFKFADLAEMLILCLKERILHPYIDQNNFNVPEDETCPIIEVLPAFMRDISILLTVSADGVFLVRLRSGRGDYLLNRMANLAPLGGERFAYLGCGVMLS